MIRSAAISRLHVLPISAEHKQDYCSYAASTRPSKVGNISSMRSFSNAKTYRVTARRMLATLARAVSRTSIIGLRNFGCIDTFLQHQSRQGQKNRQKFRVIHVFPVYTNPSNLPWASSWQHAPGGPAGMGLTGLMQVNWLLTVVASSSTVNSFIVLRR